MKTTPPPTPQQIKRINQGSVAVTLILVALILYHASK